MYYKSLWAIEVKDDNSEITTIVFDWEKGCRAIYDYKKIAKDNIERIYQKYKKDFIKNGLKHIPRRKFIIKQYIEKV